MVETKIKVYQCGYCLQRENSYKRGGTNEIQKFFGNAIVFENRHGINIFDTGYSTHWQEATKYFPYNIYAKLIPVSFKPEESLKNQLERNGISNKDVRNILVSHFHSDHYAGLKDFPYSKVICKRAGFNYIKNKHGINAAKIGFIPALIPLDLESRLEFYENKPIVPLSNSMKPFTDGYDLFGDSSIIGISLEGHSRGQIGILVNNTFFIADAIWSEDFYTQNKEQTFMANLVTDNVREQKLTLDKIRILHKNNPELKIIHSHKKWEN
jgi:glyoxylase-like metal-dependent hydrolase (beta-lactamase superfamily II)